MFERFTERARQVVVLAQDEARSLKHNYIGTEHLLLGLIREQEGVAARLLETFDVTLEEVRGQIERLVGRGEEPAASGQIPFTPRAKRVLELSLSEALSLGHNYIGTEHVLLGLVREREGIAARVLVGFGADAATVRNETIAMLAGGAPRAASAVDQESFLPPNVPASARDELARLRAEKEEAIAAQDFERAVTLREQERDLARRARREAEARWEPPDEWATATSDATAPLRGMRPEAIAGLVLAAVSFPLGLFVGWLIWG